MKRILLFGLLVGMIWGCGLPQETRRGVGNEGFLMILATPGDAEVLVDGDLAGRAEQFEKNPLELKSGTHRVVIRKTGFLPEERDVFVGNQSRNTLKANLKKAK
jgi:hypothetical protein